MSKYINKLKEDLKITEGDQIIGSSEDDGVTYNYYISSLIAYIDEKIQSLYLRLDGLNSMTGTFKGIGAVFSGNIRGVDPVVDEDLATKRFGDVNFTSVDSKEYLKLDGSEDMVGILRAPSANFSGIILGVDPVLPDHLVTKSYAEASYIEGTGFVLLDGTTPMTGDLIGGHGFFRGAISTIDPTNGEHAMTIGYADREYTSRGSAVITGTLKATSIEFKSTVTAGDPLEDGDAITREYTSNYIGDTTLPIGAVILWNQDVAEIPIGWDLCDGNNGTPNLIGKFVLGTIVSDEIRNTGGTADADMIDHTHEAPFLGVDLGSHSHTITEQIMNDGPTGAHGYGTAGGGVSMDDLTSSDTSIGPPKGSVVMADNLDDFSAVDANIPPYYKLIYIMKTV